ncbi:hypothetical protein CY34DRAFT_812476 [Suillus luteus UH-Slu-Lm8-n1]|uniref:Uncharacterized protein n=1 Tax=Suillus luteus UH-Slu-Lm8-n1 TaxID=930992 RepID=A0A0C9ZZV5_9AGAM|nr:hypothetical protein CY34DRAFT_812476 [Suillus luteus UH-Slu-Lm8-n1]
MPPFSRTPVELSRSRTEARPSGSDWFARRLMRHNLPLPQRADNTRNEWGGHSEAEAILVNPDWIMRSPSPVELYSPAYVAYGANYSTLDATCALQQFEDIDIVMASPSHHTRSPSPAQVQAGSESYWDDEPHRSITPTPDSKPWGYSPWVDTDASKFESTEDSWGTNANNDEPSDDSWGTNANNDEPSDDSWGTNATKEELSEDTKPRSSTTGALEDAWDSFSW